MTRTLQLGTWTLLSAAAVFVVHLPTLLYRLLDSDEAIYSSIAGLMNQGEPLYAQGGVDNKPPGIFWTYALTFHWFGLYQMAAVHTVALLTLGATCVVIFLIARDLAGAGTGVLSALLYGLLTAMGNPQLLASNTEIFMMLPLSGSVLLLLRRQWFWSGILLVAALAFRQTAAVNLALAATAIFWLEPSDRRLPASARFLAGVMCGLGVIVAITALTGSPAGLWRWTIETLFGYALSNWATGVALERAQDSLVPFLLSSAVLWFAAVAFVMRGRGLDARERLMVIWLGIGLLGSLAGSHLSWHYFIQTMGPLSVVAAMSFRGFEVRRPLAAAAFVGMAVPVIGWFALDIHVDPLTYADKPPVHQHAALDAYVESHTSTSDRIFVWGDWPDVYVESDRLMASRFPGFLRGFPRGSGLPPENWDTTADVWPALVADLNASPPNLIVDTSSASWSDFSRYPISDYPQLAGYVGSNYHPVARVDGVVIYERNAGIHIHDAT